MYTYGKALQSSRTLTVVRVSMLTRASRLHPEPRSMSHRPFSIHVYRLIRVSSSGISLVCLSLSLYTYIYIYIYIHAYIHIHTYILLAYLAWLGGWEESSWQANKPGNYSDKLE